MYLGIEVSSGVRNIGHSPVQIHEVFEKSMLQHWIEIDDWMSWSINIERQFVK